MGRGKAGGRIIGPPGVFGGAMKVLGLTGVPLIAGPLGLTDPGGPTGRTGVFREGRTVGAPGDLLSGVCGAPMARAAEEGGGGAVIGGMPLAGAPLRWRSSVPGVGAADTGVPRRGGVIALCLSDPNLSKSLLALL